MSLPGVPTGTTDSVVHTGTRPIGPSLRTGPLAFGCWRLVAMTTPDAQARIEAALDWDPDHPVVIDTSDVYGLDWGGQEFGEAETVLGRVLAASPGLRDRMILATKGGIIPGVPYDSSAPYLRRAVDASLRRLHAERVDLWQIHRPDLLTHPAEVAATLAALRTEGKIGEVGVSNHTTAQIVALQAHLPFPIATNQPEFSPAFLGPLRDGQFDQCMQLGITPLAWSPLAGGRLVTGDGIRTELLGTLDRLAERENVGRDAICYAFVLAHPAAPIVIIGTQTIDRIRSARAALSVRLNRQDVYDIIQASEGVNLP